MAGSAGNPEDVLSLVRSFYLDLQSWAIEEPERWAHWVVPCPVSPVAVRGERARKRRVNEKIADRIRVRKPLVPILVDHLERRRTDLRELLDLASGTALGQTFTHRGQLYRRTATSYDQQLVAAGQSTVRVIGEATGRIISLTQEEDAAF